MNIDAIKYPDVGIIEPKAFGDDSGAFVESCNVRSYASAGLDARFVQDDRPPITELSDNG